MKRVYLDRESVLTVVVSDKQTFYGQPAEFSDEQAAAMLWFEGIGREIQAHLVPLLTTRGKPGPFPESLIEAYRSATSGKKKKAPSAQEKA